MEHLRLQQGSFTLASSILPAMEPMEDNMK